MYDDSVHSRLTTVSQFVPSIFLSVGAVCAVELLERLGRSLTRGTVATALDERSNYAYRISGVVNDKPIRRTRVAACLITFMPSIEAGINIFIVAELII